MTAKKAEQLISADSKKLEKLITEAITIKAWKGEERVEEAGYGEEAKQ